MPQLASKCVLFVKFADHLQSQSQCNSILSILSIALILSPVVALFHSENVDSVNAYLYFISTCSPFFWFCDESTFKDSSSPRV